MFGNHGDIALLLGRDDFVRKGRTAAAPPRPPFPRLQSIATTSRPVVHVDLHRLSVRIHTRYVAQADLWAALVDPNRLENALLNLCINARDAMPDGGKLTIEAPNRILNERMARFHEMEPGRYVAVCVSDTGTGMTPDVVAKAFDPFFTTKPIGVDTGLGLSMIYGFARQ